MFKYVSYTPMTDAYTTHIFNEKDDKCKVHRFDVPYVSIECDNEADFNALMAYQNPIINATEIDKTQFTDLVQHSDQVKRMYDVANEQYAKDMKAVNNLYTQDEIDSWAMQVAEAKAVKDGSKEVTPFLTAFSSDRGISLSNAADEVLAKSKEYSNFSASKLKLKRATVKKLKAVVGM